MNFSTNSKVNLTTEGDFNVSTNNDVRFTFSLDKGFHITVWKTMFPLALLVTLCVCIPHRVGVI